MRLPSLGPGEIPRRRRGVCGGDRCSLRGQEETPAQTSPGGNVFQNSGFEAGRDPWFSLGAPDFILSQDTSHTGKAIAQLQLRADPDHEGTKVHYLVKEAEPERLPDGVSGYCRREAWELYITFNRWP